VIKIHKQYAYIVIETDKSNPTGMHGGRNSDFFYGFLSPFRNAYQSMSMYIEIWNR